MTLPRIDIDLACRRCGYDLRGIAADARCPECGAAALASVLERADAVAAGLPPLDRPALAGAALATAAASFGLGLLALCVASAWPEAPAAGAARAIAAGSAIVTTGAAITLARRFGSRRRRVRRRLQGAAFAWAAAAIASWSWPPLPLGFVMAAAAFLIASLGGPLGELGARSVRFRRQGPSRQPIGTLVAAAAIAAGAGLASEAIRRLGFEAGGPGEWLLVLEWTMVGLACLGAGYLVANAMVIARSLGEPAIDPDQLLEGAAKRPGPSG